MENGFGGHEERLYVIEVDGNCPTRRRWHRFSLSRMLVLVSLVCFCFGYLGWAMNWMRQRQQALEDKWSRAVRTLSDTPSPLALRLLGESGVDNFFIVNGAEKELTKVSQLFPEAEVHFFVLEKNGQRYFTKSSIKDRDAFATTAYYQNGVLFREHLLVIEEETKQW